MDVKKSFFKNYFNKVLSTIKEHAENVGNPYELFGVFGLITYPFYYLVWIYTAPLGYENLTLRLIATLLCIPLIFKNKWNNEYLKYLPLYWYFTICYCLPFLFTFLLLKNSFSFEWNLNIMTVLILTILLLDLVPLFIVLSLGVIMGVLFYKLTGNIIHLPSNYIAILVTYLSVILFGALFAHRKEIIRNEKLQTVRTLAIDIAHELRTPLAAIYAGAKGTKNYLPDLLHAYELAKEHELPVAEIRPSQAKLISSAMDGIIAETNYSNTIINMILTNVDQQSIKQTEFQVCSIAHCIDEALERYPFQSGEREFIQWDRKDDFHFMGKDIFTIHIFFNLLKNAIYYVKASRKEKRTIEIWLEKGDDYNKLHFRDSGKGISADILPKIFDLFFSQTQHGSGIGLAFCKIVMESYGGKIECKSVEGEFTEFILSFPVISRDTEAK